MKLIHKLILGFLLIALLSWIAGIYTVYVNKKELQELILKDTETLLIETLDKVDRHINSRIELFQEYSRDLIVKNTIYKSNKDFEELKNREAYLVKLDREWTNTPEKEIAHFMKDLLENNLSEELRGKISFYEQKHGYSVFGEVFVTNRYGANVALTGRTTDYRQDDEEWWQGAQKNGIHVDDVNYDESAGVYSIDIGLRIDDEEGNSIGVMKIVLNVQEVIKIMGEMHASVLHSGHKFMRHFLISKKGKLLYSSQKDDQFLEDVSHLIPSKHISARAENGKSTAGNFFIQEGDDELLVSHAHSEGYGLFKGLSWILVLQHDTEEIFIPITQLRKRVVATSFSLTLFGLLIAYIVSLSITRNINKLQKAATRIGKGHLNTEIDVKSHDEIGMLARTFKKMTDDLKTTIISRDRLAEEINERRKAENQFEQSRQDWKDTFDTITDMVTIHDRDYNIIRANKAAKEVLRLPESELSKVLKCYTYYHGKDCPPEGCPSCVSMKTGKPSTFEFFESHLNKYIEVRAIPRFDADKEMSGLIHVVRDVTERKKIEDAIKRGRAEWEMTFDNASEFIVLVDRDGKIVRCNKTFADFVHTPINDLIGLQCSDIVPVSLEQLKPGMPAIKVEVMTTNKEWLYLSSCPIVDEKGQYVRTVIVGTDITSLKYTEERLLKSEEELKKKVEDLESFYEMAVGRELRMKEIKKEMDKLKNELSSYRNKSAKTEK
jgi:PAS domain-containing protein